MKMHLNLATRDLDASVAFYKILLDAQPAKTLPDYALFITENPGLELALDLDATAVAGHAEHFGIVVDSAEAVEEKAARLTSAGFAIDVEREETCCYAVQTKVWASDPDGRRWETYVVHEETEARDDVAAAGAEPACCP
jgi:catechol 2,3-dioxygenase-like lactoylglutathione lyase family enzyme